MDRFQAVRAFVRVVELGSFAKAAARLGMSTSAVSRQVADLEAHLSVRLLQRTTRRLSLTDTGQSFYERGVQLLADLEEAEASVRAAAVLPQGTLRLTCAVTFGIRHVAPAIAEFTAKYPQVVVDVDLSDRAVDLVEEGFDLGIRIGAIGQQGLVSRRLGGTSMVLCASPRYLARHPDRPLRTPADLAAHDCLSYTQVPLPNVWRFTAPDGTRHEAKIATRHRVNNGRMLVALAVEGLGVIHEPDFIVGPELRAGRLVRVLPDFAPPRSTIAAVYPSRRLLSTKVRTFVDFLAQRFADYAAW
jgi:DNA-binding transcriptional LysR family regulator